MASLVVGAVALLAGLLCLLLVAVAAIFADRLWNGMARIAVAAVGYVGWVGLMALGLAAVRFGRRSVLAARRLGQPPARGRAGVLLGSLGLFAAVGAGLAWTVLWIDQLM